MTLEFLIFANLVLLLRLRLLLVDPAPSAGAWVRKAVIELLACGLFGWTGAMLVLASVTAVMNAAGLWASRRRSHREEWQVALGIAHLLLLSVALSAGSGAQFCGDFPAFAERLGRWTTFGSAIRAGFSPYAQAVLLGLLLSANEANLLLRAVFERLEIKPRRRSPGSELDAGEYNRGRVIGLLERALIYFFVLNGQFGVIGFTLAAKAFTRFKELEDRAFAEYVLIGTLLSSTLAVVAGLLVHALA